MVSHKTRISIKIFDLVQLIQYDPLETMKHIASTSLDAEVISRIKKLAAANFTSEAAILRRLVHHSLPHVEREVLGEQFVGASPGLPKDEEVNGL